MLLMPLIPVMAAGDSVLRHRMATLLGSWLVRGRFVEKKTSRRQNDAIESKSS